jgi:hypothetical protein
VGHQGDPADIEKALPPTAIRPYAAQRDVHGVVNDIEAISDRRQDAAIPPSTPSASRRRDLKTDA